MNLQELMASAVSNLPVAGRVVAKLNSVKLNEQDWRLVKLLSGFAIELIASSVLLTAFVAGAVGPTVLIGLAPLSYRCVRVLVAAHRS